MCLRAHAKKQKKAKMRGKCRRRKRRSHGGYYLILVVVFHPVHRYNYLKATEEDANEDEDDEEEEEEEGEGEARLANAGSHMT